MVNGERNVQLRGGGLRVEVFVLLILCVCKSKYELQSSLFAILGRDFAVVEIDRITNDGKS